MTKLVVNAQNPRRGSVEKTPARSEPVARAHRAGHTKAPQPRDAECSRRPSRTRTGAFTLIELIVIIDGARDPLGCCHPEYIDYTANAKSVGRKGTLGARPHRDRELLRELGAHRAPRPSRRWCSSRRWHGHAGIPAVQPVHSGTTRARDLGRHAPSAAPPGTTTTSPSGGFWCNSTTAGATSTSGNPAPLFGHGSVRGSANAHPIAYSRAASPSDRGFSLSRSWSSAHRQDPGGLAIASCRTAGRCARPRRPGPGVRLLVRAGAGPDLRAATWVYVYTNTRDLHYSETSAAR